MRTVVSLQTSETNGKKKKKLGGICYKLPNIVCKIRWNVKTTHTWDTKSWAEYIHLWVAGLYLSVYVSDSQVSHYNNQYLE